MMKKFALLFIVILFVSLTEINAQNNLNLDSTTTSQTEPKKTKTLDTNESIKYMSSSLWFQMKKRLNLTTEEEEKQEAENKKKKRILTIAGIKIEN
jgi:hypothetical protein